MTLGFFEAVLLTAMPNHWESLDIEEIIISFGWRFGAIEKSMPRSAYGVQGIDDVDAIVTA